MERGLEKLESVEQFKAWLDKRAADMEEASHNVRCRVGPKLLAKGMAEHNTDIDDPSEVEKISESFMRDGGKIYEAATHKGLVRVTIGERTVNLPKKFIATEAERWA